MHFNGDCKVVRGLALGFQPCRLGASLRLQGPRSLVELNEGETVSVHIFEERVPRSPTPPGWLYRRQRKIDATFRPLVKYRSYIFRSEN